MAHLIDVSDIKEKMEEAGKPKGTIKSYLWHFQQDIAHLFGLFRPPNDDLMKDDNIQKLIKWVNKEFEVNDRPLYLISYKQALIHLGYDVSGLKAFNDAIDK